MSVRSSFAIHGDINMQKTLLKGKFKLWNKNLVERKFILDNFEPFDWKQTCQFQGHTE
jgi:hypothetical protein